MPFQQGPRITPAAERVQNMIAGVQANAAKWQAHTIAPKRNPKAAALAANQKYKNAMTEAIQQDRFAAGIRNYDEDAAVATIQQIGAANLVNGVAARQAKIEKANAALDTSLLAHLRTIDAMPTNTAQEREQKMLANLRGMKALKRGGAGPTGR